MYSEGLGYQFTYCDSGVGVYILSDRKGSENDLMYINMPFMDIGFNNLPWEELYAVVDAYCANQSGIVVPEQNVTLEEAEAIAVDWAAFYAQWQNGTKDLGNFTVQELKSWVENYQ